MNLCVLIPVLTGVISALLGYLLGKLLADDRSADVELWKTKYIGVEKELAMCRTQLSSLKKDQIKGVPFDPEAAKSVFGRTIKENDLKVVEGIGPKIEELFKKHGIDTWARLASTSVEHCRDILDSEGERFRIHDPETWHEQARLAYQGKWDKLYEWQQQLKGGKM
ncbi:hypothetical protein [Robertkochia flava]|uniref:hypothetical protein n=1 Tax=Robertkochia flava TaxID=3447986 RepID=UPI001CCBC13B|nr:hypothetical protein [Robertkochia marina]